jgi:hypothetical protein
MLRDLTLYEAREAYKRLRPDDHPKSYVFSDCECGKNGWSWGGFGRSYGPHDDWLEKISVIGPNGANLKELDPWFGVAPCMVDMTYLCRCGHRKGPEPPWDQSRTDFWNDPKLWDGIDPTKQMCWSKRESPSDRDDSDLPEPGDDRAKPRQRVSANLRHPKAPKSDTRLSRHDRREHSQRLAAASDCGEAA